MGNKVLYLPPTKETPSILLDENDGVIEFTGRSFPEDALSFYRPIMDSLPSFLTYVDFVRVDFRFEYFNTSSARCLFGICKQVATFKKSDEHIQVNWYYDEEDEDMLEIGEDFDELTDLHFNFLKY